MTGKPPGPNNTDCDPGTKKCYALNKDGSIFDGEPSKTPGNAWMCPAKTVLDSPEGSNSPEGSTSAADCVGDDAILHISIDRQHMKYLFCNLIVLAPVSVASVPHLIKVEPLWS
jgi:hypothetical protein